MHPDELAATYQLHAADCIQIAQRMTDPKSRLSLLAMAQSWLKLAEQAVGAAKRRWSTRRPRRKRRPSARRLSKAFRLDSLDFNSY
jgi:hypothetical protein